MSNDCIALGVWKAISIDSHESYVQMLHVPGNNVGPIVIRESIVVLIPPANQMPRYRPKTEKGRNGSKESRCVPPKVLHHESMKEILFGNANVDEIGIRLS